MPLASGTRLGPYEIQATIGAGGMGEVYRACDTRLNRIVAIKILSAHFANDPEFRQRFEREARIISQLNHAHICALYDVGHQSGIDYLVLEFIEGETLAERIGRGPLPVAQALKIATDICDALDKAHRRGIIHRDLKPGNIILTKTGAKLLDFGLAKTAATPSTPANELSLTSPVLAATGLTARGTIVGTFQYMAPEQLEGQNADARTDIWAFGSVLFEMLTGKRAFDAKSTPTVIAAILDHHPPPVSSVQPLVPAPLDRVVRHCLAKDPDERWQSCHDLLLELQGLAEAESRVTAPAHVGARPARREQLAWALVLLAVLATTAVTRRYLATARPGDRPIHLSVLPPPQTMIRPFDIPFISPDGRRVASTGFLSGRDFLWVRSLDSATAQPIPNTEGAFLPFWSPDSRSIAFFTLSAGLKKVSADGGPVVTLVGDVRWSWGGTWNRQGEILFARSDRNGVWMVPESGGTPVRVTTVNTAAGELEHRYPHFLPNGRHFLYVVVSTKPDTAGVYLYSQETGQSRRLLDGGAATWFAAPGYLLYARGGTLFAQRFDLRDLAVTGHPVPITARVDQSFGLGYFSVSDGGIAYLPASANSRLVLHSRNGASIRDIADAGAYAQATISPDDKLIAAQIGGDIWIVNLARGASSRLTFDPATDGDPVWSPDSRYVSFFSMRRGKADLFRKLVGGSEDELLLDSNDDKFPEDWSSDGRSIVFIAFGGRRVYVLPLFGDRTPQQVFDTSFLSNEFHISPDGRWIAYNSVETGRSEVYVASFPGFADKRQVSTNGGCQAIWRRDGNELFYLGMDGKLMSVEVQRGRSLEAGTPQVLFQTRVRINPNFDQYAVLKDAEQFIVIEPAEDTTTLNVILNWAAELQGR